MPGLWGPKARASLGGGGNNKKSILSECLLEPQKCNQIHQLQFKGFFTNWYTKKFYKLVYKLVLQIAVLKQIGNLERTKISLNLLASENINRKKKQVIATLDASIFVLDYLCETSCSIIKLKLYPAIKYNTVSFDKQSYTLP